MEKNLVCKQPGCHNPVYDAGRCPPHRAGMLMEAELKTVRSRCRTALMRIRRNRDFATSAPWNCLPGPDFDFHKLEKALVKSLRILDEYDNQVV